MSLSSFERFQREFFPTDCSFSYLLFSYLDLYWPWTDIHGQIINQSMKIYFLNNNTKLQFVYASNIASGQMATREALR